MEGNKLMHLCMTDSTYSHVREDHMLWYELLNKDYGVDKETSLQLGQNPFDVYKFMYATTLTKGSSVELTIKINIPKIHSLEGLLLLKKLEGKNSIFNVERYRSDGTDGNDFAYTDQICELLLTQPNDIIFNYLPDRDISLSREFIEDDNFDLEYHQSKTLKS